MSQAANVQFERAVREFVRWREVPEPERSPAPAWWWGPAFEVLGMQQPMPARVVFEPGVAGRLASRDRRECVPEIARRPNVAAVARRFSAQGGVFQSVLAPGASPTQKCFSRPPRPRGSPHRSGRAETTTLRCTGQIFGAKSLPSGGRFETIADDNKQDPPSRGRRKRKSHADRPGRPSHADRRGAAQGRRRIGRGSRRRRASAASTPISPAMIRTASSRSRPISTASRPAISCPARSGPSCRNRRPRR